jgi:hypothetical protein
MVRVKVEASWKATRRMTMTLLEDGGIGGGWRLRRQHWRKTAMAVAVFMLGEFTSRKGIELGEGHIHGVERRWWD